jgi:hypothetical protein
MRVREAFDFNERVDDVREVGREKPNGDVELR